jgi:cytochrome c oxidase subunit II
MIRFPPAVCAPAVLLLSACAGSPSYLHTFGYRGDQESRLGWVLLIIASIVIVVVSVLLIAALVRRRREDGEPMRSGGGVSWIIVGGIAVPGLILLGVLFLAMSTLAADTAPPSKPSITIQVVGHRWWWEVRYPGTSPSDLLVTANEIHIPTGQPVRLELTTADVIHSFWIPQLAGKMDLVPGQRNTTWIEADSTGTYWGQCGEYCGLQHANMMMSVTAESPDRFTRWRQSEREPAVEPDDRASTIGMHAFQNSACAVCHTIRGTGAAGAIGPDLTHVGSRRTLAAGSIPNTRGYLAGWIANPQGVKRGVLMPAVPMSPGELNAIVTYLQSLK